MYFKSDEVDVYIAMSGCWGIWEDGLVYCVWVMSWEALWVSGEMCVIVMVMC